MLSNVQKVLPFCTLVSLKKAVICTADAVVIVTLITSVA